MSSMKDNVIMRCGTNHVTFVTISNHGVFTNVESFYISTHNTDEKAWLKALSITLSQVPKKLKEQVSIVIPPNWNIFTKYITLPEVDKNKTKEALSFEFKQNFPGEPEEWIWEPYRFNKNTNDVFIIAMQRGFTEHFLDALLRNNLNFSYLCPEILLLQASLPKQTHADENCILAQIGTSNTLLYISNKKAQYIRMIPIADDWIDKQIAVSQKISLQDARKVKDSQIKLLNDKSASSFIKYYIRQFAQKIQQELKRSELFFCRTFNQTQTSKMILCGSVVHIQEFSDTIQEFNQNVEVEQASSYAPQKLFHKSLSDEKRNTLSENILTYLGAIEILSRNDSPVLNLFSDIFKKQIYFQQRHPTYMAAMIIVILVTMLGLKLNKQKVTFLESQKLALEAKLRESIIDSQKYKETIESEQRLRESIIYIKNMLYSQDSWLEIFNCLQQSINQLKCSWIDSFHWKDSDKPNIIHIIVKTFIDEANAQGVNDIETFLNSIKTCNMISKINNVVISETKDSVRSFSFDIELNNNSKIFVK